ncbi:methylmalonyl-CoA epimerase [uncultured Bartonella sp.]|uniref:methylmalonyl-CoA epimerase n=1 Tax=uncultured Bartonella sp. TaxID=104108 RepID=UPI0026144118|nr:methylmalonyl-CoA epimerase [uncultured Bartonella sp.]
MCHFGRLNHVAIAVPDLQQAIALYRAMSVDVSPIHKLTDHGVCVAFVELSNTKLELMSPLNNESPIASFLAKNPAGGIHHICFEVDDIIKMRDQLIAEGIRILGDGQPKTGAHGKPVLFIHPKDFNSTLVEIEEV